MNTILLVPVGPDVNRRCIFPENASPEQLFVRKAELDLGVNLLKDSPSLHRRQAQYEQELIERELKARYPNRWDTWVTALRPIYDTAKQEKTGRPGVPYPLTREGVEVCADWAVGKYGDNKDYLSADNTVESELPLDTDLYKNGLTKEFIEQVLSKVTDKQKLTRTNRLAVKIAYVDPDEEYNGLDKTCFRTWRECTITKNARRVKMSQSDFKSVEEFRKNDPMWEYTLHWEVDWVDGSVPRSFIMDNYIRFDRALYGRYVPLDDPNDEHHTVWSIYRYPVRLARVRARAGDPRAVAAEASRIPLPDSDESDPEPPDYESEEEFAAPKPRAPGLPKVAGRYKGVFLNRPKPPKAATVLEDFSPPLVPVDEPPPYQLPTPPPHTQPEGSPRCSTVRGQGKSTRLLRGTWKRRCRPRSRCPRSICHPRGVKANTTQTRPPNRKYSAIGPLL